MAKSIGIPPKAIISIILIAASIYALVYYYSTRTSNAPVAIKVVAIDIETGEMIEIIKGPDEEWPLTNPETKMPTLYEAYICRKGRVLFPVRGMRMICPYCRSFDIGGISPNEDYTDCKVRMEYFLE